MNIRLLKAMLAINGITLVINGVIVWLTVVREFPAVLGVLLVAAGFAGAIWLSARANGKRLKITL